MQAVTAEVLEKLKEVSSATAAGALQRKGFRNNCMVGVRPIKPGLRLLGKAVTLRYLPRREDKVLTPEKRETYAQRLAVNSLKKGDVLVVDARGNTRVGIFGDLVVMRMQYLGSTGLVTDGALRDTPYLRTIDFPCFACGTNGYPHVTEHWAADMNLPIACGGVTVEPGDIMLGDDDGVVVIPPPLVEEIATGGSEQENIEAFARELITKGRADSYERIGLPPELKSEYERWLKRRHKK